MKKVLKIVGIILLVLVLVVVGYVVYVFGSYSRIEDGQSLEAAWGDDVKPAVQTGETYKIVSWNIGFGAYEQDFGFFMDGGSQAWAWSEERLMENLDRIGQQLAEQEADFQLIQEVDFGSTRSYQVNEKELLRTFGGQDERTASVFAVNYDSAFLAYPFHQPIGASQSGILTISNFAIGHAQRVSLPIEEGLTKILDLDRCYSISRIPVEGGKELVLYNLHLSAYTSDGKIADEQLALLLQDMQGEYDKGNYVVGGGDFNKDLLGDSSQWFGVSTEGYTWAQPIRFDLLEGKNLTLVAPLDENDPQPSCRNADGPYHQGQLVLTMDGFLVSDNVTVLSDTVIDTDFTSSDHEAVVMEFVLND